jgi:hypothetical protein
LMDELAYAK